jgi:hypothetical protein
MGEERDLSKRSLLISAAFLLFIGGMAVGHYQVFPYSLLKFGKDSVVEVFGDRNTILRIRPDRLLNPARYDGQGVTRNLPGKAEPGLTFISSVFDDSNEMRLVRLDGSIVNRWPVTFSSIFPNPNHIEPKERIPQTEWNTELHGGVVLPDGSVVFNFEGAGLAKLDKCGVVQWALPRMTHHSVERAQDGGFWVGGHRYVRDPAILPPLGVPFLENTILRISDDGKVMQEISLPGLFLKNHLSALLLVRMQDRVPFLPYSDLTHLNDIEELSRELAIAFPRFAAGDLLISIRRLNTIMVFNPLTERVKWHQTGPWIAQHDPDFQQNGRITVFNNNDDGTPAGSVFGGSTVIEIDPVTDNAKTLYGGSLTQRMYSNIRGKHQKLANGNLLITESEAGRLLEVDGNGEIVWEYVNRYDDKDVAIIFGATRYPEDYFTVTDWHCP